MEMQEFEEKRIFPRFQVRLSASIIDPLTQMEERFKTHDISAQGLGLIWTKQLAVGTVIEMRLKMPDSDEEIYIKGKVVWCGTDTRIGVRINRKQLKPIPIVLRSLESQLYHS
jgi:hypothetical protein